MKKGNFTGKTSDMDWHVVELRRALEREMKRFQTAKMTDKYEEVLQAKLDELASAPRPPDTNSIHIHHLECEDFNRLHKFHQAVLELCSRPDQYERYETILREMLLKSRVKSPTSNGAIKPFCVICGSNLSCFPSCDRAEQIEVTPVYPIFDQAAAAAAAQYTDMNMAGGGVGEATPPPSAAATPEVGEQAPHQAATGGQQGAEPSDQPRGAMGEQVGRNMGEEHPSLTDLQCRFSQSYTSQFASQVYTPYIPSVLNINMCSVNAETLAASTTPPTTPTTPAPPVSGSDSQQVNSTTSQPLTQQVPSNTNASTQQDLPQQQQSNHTKQRPMPREPQPGPSGTASKEVRPSDDSDSDSDSDQHDEIRHICSNLGAYQLANGGGLRSSTPLSDRMHQSQGKLVIDESEHMPTPAKRARKTKVGAKHSLGTARISTNGTKPVSASELKKQSVSAGDAATAAAAGAASTHEERTPVRNQPRKAMVKKRPKRGHATKKF